MRILLLTNYYTPDFGAGSFRMQALVDAFARSNENNLKVDLYTTFPNRYGSRFENLKEFEDHGWLTVNRIRLPKHNGKMVSQAISYSKFFFSVLYLCRKQKYDLVFATSSRLITAFLGSLIAKRKQAILFLDIRDIFSDTLKDLFKQSNLRVVLPIINYVEKKTLMVADAVNIVSPGFDQHIRSLTKLKDLNVITNGIDQEFCNMEPDFSSSIRKIPEIVYAGNIGDGQGLERIIPEAAKRLEGYAKFKVIGDGGKKNELKKRLIEQNCKNVEILVPVTRSELINIYAHADILFLHLNDFPSFRKVLPSKIFEYAATGKPIIGGVSGCARDLLLNEVPGAYVFDPADINNFVGIVKKASQLNSNYDRTDFIKKYRRENLMDELVDAILKMKVNLEASS